MILFKPTLIIKNILLLKERTCIYEAAFHEGLNIIHGQNGSGKSTITELIFYSIGGEMTEWKEPADKCDNVYVEVQINGQTATFCREIVLKNPCTPMDIYWGSLKDALIAEKTEWKRYPYKATENKESFSQVIFNALDFPRVKAEDSGNITMNQILRLIYADQLTPGARIFKLQEKWDSGLLRQTVGDFLCGVYDDDIYNAKLSLIQKNKAFDLAAAQLRNIFSILGNADQAFGTIDFKEARQEISNLLLKLHDEIRVLKNSATLIDGRTNTKANKYSLEISGILVKVSNLILKLNEEINILNFEILDSEAFINELERRKKALTESSLTSKYLGQLVFSMCPCCMSHITQHLENTGTCSLCKSDLENDAREANIFQMSNELNNQIKESRLNLSKRKIKVNEISLKLTEALDNRKNIYQSLKGYANQWSTENERLIDSKNIEIGKLNQELVNLSDKEKLHKLIENLQEDRTNLNAEILKIKDFIKNKEYQQEKRRENAYESIQKFIVEILHKDLDRQDDFSGATEARIDFDGNSILVNKKKTFSASSLVLLKNSFHLAFLLASTNINSFRYPRLLILDGIEDGGMEEIRSNNFQKIIKNYSDNIKVSHQIILTTAKLTPELDDQKYLIGLAYTTQNRTLNIAGRTLPFPVLKSVKLGSDSN